MDAAVWDERRRQGVTTGLSGGWCARCGCVHELAIAGVIDECLALMAYLEREKRIDGLDEATVPDPSLRTDALFTEAGGKMFGLLACRNAAGQRVLLRAFSGQYQGRWSVPGWVEPICDPDQFAALVAAPDQAIKQLGRELAALPASSAASRVLRQQRKQLSQDLMAAIHDLYTLTNFRGESVPLTAAFVGSGAPPAGTGDCCGPKLLHHAATHGLRPEAMAEFFWGRPPESGQKQHGFFYPACATKCQPILGFQLCGL